MAKYAALKQFLAGQRFDEIPMSFAEVETVIGRPLPMSAVQHRPWWANEARGHVHAKAWLDAGFATSQVDMAAKKLVFKRIARRKGGPESTGRNAATPGLHEQQALFRNADAAAHPAFGAMKGTFSIEPGCDLAQPIFAAEEWAHIEEDMLAGYDELFPPSAK